ncbi:hypothetical protein NR798_06960 [Archangium gephyra]|uniref:hypothetical protein n=1 Tax=Archangium gephyra TaxID=48 RepID=UPI0035D48B7F
MVRTRLPLVALMGTMGCTQDASAPDTVSADGSPSLLQRLKGESTSKGGSVRALSPEERESLFPQAAAAPASEDAGALPDYAEQRRQQYAQRMQQLQEDAASRDAGTGRTPEEAEAEKALATGPEPEDLSGQRRQQLARERVEAERFRKYGKGGGIKRGEFIHIIRAPDAGTPATVKE